MFLEHATLELLSQEYITLTTFDLTSPLYVILYPMKEVLIVKHLINTSQIHPLSMKR